MGSRKNPACTERIAFNFSTPQTSLICRGFENPFAPWGPENCDERYKPLWNAFYNDGCAFATSCASCVKNEAPAIAGAP